MNDLMLWGNTAAYQTLTPKGTISTLCDFKPQWALKT